MLRKQYSCVWLMRSLLKHYQVFVLLMWIRFHQAKKYLTPPPGIFPTLYDVSRRRLAPSPGFIADPLLTAFSPDFDPAWRVAPHPGRLGLCAQRHAADGPVYTHTLIFTAGLEALPVTVDHTIMLTAWSHHICYRGEVSRHLLYRTNGSAKWMLSHL